MVSTITSRLATEKSVCITVGHNRPKSDAHIYLGNMKLEWADSIKYLKITF